MKGTTLRAGGTNDKEAVFQFGKAPVKIFVGK